MFGLSAYQQLPRAYYDIETHSTMQLHEYLFSTK
jgi:hypothetical protein